MLSRKKRHVVYATLLLSLCIVTTTAIANTGFYELFAKISSVNEEPALKATTVLNLTDTTPSKITSSSSPYVTGTTSMSSLFMTIIQGADEEVTCADDGSVVARFNLCGDFDTRMITAQGSHSSFSWQRLTGGTNCDIDADCPQQSIGGGGNCGGTWVEEASSAAFTIDPISVSPATGAEFRLSVSPGGGAPFYHFKVKRSTITQTFIKTDFICGVPGRIQITNLSSAFEYNIDNGSGFGTWQASPIFNNLEPGNYTVSARLQNTPNTCEYPYMPVTIEQQDINIDLNFVDASCFGETGSITVNVNDVPGPFRYTLLDSSGTPQEFTTFIPDNPYTFAAVGFGTYSVQVETQQCIGDPSLGILAPRQDIDTAGNPIVIGNGLSPLSASTEANNSFGCNVTDVDIIVRTSGGTGTYTFTVSDGGSSSSSFIDGMDIVYNVTTSGTYDFIITDENGCTTTASANVEELVPPDVAATGTDGTCTNGGARISINILDARGYNLSFRAMPSDPWSTNPVLSVPEGTYDEIEVRYAQGDFDCILSLPDVVTVVNVGAITGGNAVKIADLTCTAFGGTLGGSIEFQGTFTGGAGSGYIFSISGDNQANFSNQTLYDNLSPGTYTPIVRDSGGCRLELTPITILDVDAPTNIDFSQSNTNCAANTSDVVLTPIASAAIVRYEIISPITINNGADNIFTGLTNNTDYVFRITDANNCQYEETFAPVIISSIRARVKSGGDLRICNGAADGSGTFIIDGFANSYSYDIPTVGSSGPQSNNEIDLTGLAAGVYTITVTDTDTGCTDTSTITIVEAAVLELTGDITPMSCANNNIGRVVAETTGGWGGNRYTLTRPGGTTTASQSSIVFGNLTQEGTYTLSVEDVEGCTANFIFDLITLDSPTIALDTGSSNFCFVPGIGATLAVNSVAGSALIASHQYRINGGLLQTSSNFTGLAPGNYTIEVVDSNNCSSALSLVVEPQLRVNATIINEVPCGAAGGRIQIDATGGHLAGIGAKQYEVSSDNGTSFGAPVPLLSNSFFEDTNVPGTYIFRITDNEGCIAVSNPVILNPPANIAQATADVIGASCGDTDNGIVNIVPNATSGIPPYEVSFDGAPFSSQTLFSNLNAGQTYTYVVRDARGCQTEVANITIPISNNPPDANVSAEDAICSPIDNAASGAIRINNVANGVPDFIYIIEDQFGTEITRVGPTSSTSELITNPLLVTGTYRVITLDANGCRDEDLVTISQTTLSVVPDPIPLPICNLIGFTNTVEIVGGVGPDFLIRLVGDTNPPVTPNQPPRRHTFNELQFGVTYTVEVTDLGTGCIFFVEIPPQEGPSPLDVTASSTPGFCNAATRNGEITYTVSGFTANTDLLIEVLNSDTGEQITIATPTNVSPDFSGTYETLPGNYQIIVTDLSINCNAAAAVVITQNLPNLTIVSSEPANCNAFGQIVVRGSGGNGGPYTYAFVSGGDPEPPLSAFSEQTTFTGPAGNYDVYLRDSTGCPSFANATIIDLSPNLPPPTFAVDNQCDVSTTTFDITVSMPSTVDTPRFTLGGVTMVTNPATFQVSSPGSYIVDVVDANGCISTGTAQVFEFLNGFGDFSVEPSCNNTDGIITIETGGGSGDFSFELTGVNFNGALIDIVQINNRIFTNIAPGNYEVLVTDNQVNDGVMNCTFLVNNITLEAAVVPVITLTPLQNISCNGLNDGSIDIILQTGTDIDSPISYQLVDFDTRAPIGLPNNSGSFPNLAQGRYDVEVLSSRNCPATAGLLEIIEPLPFSIMASAPDFTCDTGANTFSSTIITTTLLEPGTATGGYQYSITGFENYQASPEFEIIDNGSPQIITVFAIDGNGCETQSDPITINPPEDVIPSITDSSALSCVNAERVEVRVVGTTNFRVVVSPSVPGSPFNNMGGASTVDVFLPNAGDYLLVVEDLTDPANVCSFPLPLYTVDEPISPTVLISEASPVICDGDSNGALFVQVDNYTGTYSYEAFLVDNTGNRILPAQAIGSFNTVDFPDIIGDQARITGLPGGNFIVDIVSIDNPECPGTSNLATVRSPNGPLVVTAMEIGNVSCNNSTGNIIANGTGGWDISPYEYRLLQNDGTGTVSEIMAYSPNNDFKDLSSGNYQVEIRDIQGCISTIDINLNAIAPIEAGIREPQSLICPSGNNAVLEAFDPSTGNLDTAIAGATGGVSGAGYNYQLIYLGSNDITDELSRSGLQGSPTFIGASGEGFLSSGWYAIEITSSFECVGVTIPHFIAAPPPVIPSLIQVEAPGCGGQGQMRLTIDNPVVGFEYEYRLVGITIPFIAMGAGITSVLIDETPGFFQYEVRTVNNTAICDVVLSNGLTLVDAQDLDLNVNLPDDISCASELDGRIESFAAGGIGSNSFFLYTGDPGDPFSPNITATLVRGPQNNGTFEGLPEGIDYFVAVTSGATCSDVDGPYVIIRPEPILFTLVANPVSCNGETDGSIRVEVTSGGEGLIQFALGPNFSNFSSDPDNPGIFTFENLGGATGLGREYTILIQDARGCSELTSTFVIEPEILNVSAETTNETCIGFEDGTGQLTITGGTPFVDAVTFVPYYETSLNSSEDANFVRNDSLFFDNLPATNHVIFVRDANGCLIDIILPIEIGVDLVPEAIVEYGCEGIFPNSTVTVQLEDSSQLADVLFALDPLDPTNAISSNASLERVWGDLPAGDHTVYVYHSNGCTTMVDFTLDAFDPLTLVAAKTGPNEITAIATGGFGGYEFFFQGDSFGSQNVFTLNQDDTVTVRVVDQRGCVASMTLLFDFDGMLDIPNFFTPDGDNINDEFSPKNRDFFPNIEVKIYDRYGRVVAILDQVSTWDGTYEGRELPSGDYWYVVNANDKENQQFVGHFTLYR